MENEENRGLIDKKSSNDQLVPFFSLVLELSHYSLSLSHSWTQCFLGALSIGERNEKEGKKKEGASKEEQDQATTTRLFAGIDFHV